MRVVVAQYEGIDATPVLPLAAGCLVAAARIDPELAGVDFSIALERLPIARAVEALARPDVLGLSLYPWNAAYGLAVARAARESSPDCLIVAGGPSVPRRPERARRFLAEHPAIDVLVFGEGEITFRELLRARLQGATLDHIPGIAFRATESAPHFTAPPGRVNDFTVTASPYLDGTFDDAHRARPVPLQHGPLRNQSRLPVLLHLLRLVAYKEGGRIPARARPCGTRLGRRHGFSHLMLADANFGIRPRDTAIARRLVDLKSAPARRASFYFYLTKNNHGRNLETIEILQSGGIGTWVGLAVQDFDDDVLEAVKRDNIQTGEAMKLRGICGERGIPTFNELILRSPRADIQFVRRAPSPPRCPRSRVTISCSSFAA